jgi:hypothetical protein
MFNIVENYLIIKQSCTTKITWNQYWQFCIKSLIIKTLASQHCYSIWTWQKVFEEGIYDKSDVDKILYHHDNSSSSSSVLQSYLHNITQIPNIGFQNCFTSIKYKMHTLQTSLVLEAMLEKSLRVVDPPGFLIAQI